MLTGCYKCGGLVLAAASAFPWQQVSVVDDFDVVTVRVEHEGSVILVVILGSKAGRAVVSPSGSQGEAVELVDLLSTGGSESKVRVGDLTLGLVQKELSELQMVRGFLVLVLEAQGLDDGSVEGATGLQVAHLDVNVVEDGLEVSVAHPGGFSKEEGSLLAAILGGGLPAERSVWVVEVAPTLT